MSFGERFRQLRESRGMTQAEVAKLLDPPYTAQAVHKWEVNGNTPKMPILRQLADMFGVTISELLDEPDRLMPVPSTATLPLLSLGTVHAGDPKEAIEDRLVVQAPADVVNRHPNGYFLLVEGDCMDTSYPEGCHVLVDPDMQPRNGSAVVAEFMGDTVLRRFHRFTDTLILSSDSSKPYPDIVVRGDMEVRILGVVVWFQASKDVR